MEYYDKAIASEICCIFIKICYNIGKYIILFFTSFRMYDFLFLPWLFFLRDIGLSLICNRDNHYFPAYI